MRIAIVQFPGSNADWDALHVARNVLGTDAYYVFHQEADLRDADAVILPGGFSYGDYLRPGAIARFSKIVPAIVDFASAGGPVLGICNGFQILTEMGLLPGALTRNEQLRFECRDVRVECGAEGTFTAGIVGQTLRLPIAHADGRYQCDSKTLQHLKSKNLIAFRYVDGNPNGSIADIAGIYNDARNVLGLMPHPERASETILGNADGRHLFQSLIAHLDGKAA
ncbi:MAG: phosphoribosylformylglycinamidine synthase subunit PurQ [Myxococcales bacterium]|nr:phosphoribosylformylglycinamidine synthase subunit PurQ [Myxococcales bacterium]